MLLLPNKYPSAFTLIELLVTISVIAILLAIGAPAMSSISSKARSIDCQSNLRQMGASYLTYVSDNGGVFPDPYDANSGKTWKSILENGDYLPQRASTKNVEACPEDWKINQKKFKNPNNPSTYGINQFVGEPATEAQGAVAKIWRMTNIPKPAGMALIMDGIFNPAKGYWNAIVGPADSRSALHSKGLNVFFADGHIANVALPDIPSTSPSSGASIPSLQFWWGRDTTK